MIKGETESTSGAPEFWNPKVEPFEGESVSHYFGRWRRHELNCVSAPTALSRGAGIGFALSRWEKLRFNPFPTQQELGKIGKYIGLEPEKLLALFPPKGTPTVNRSVRFCAVCYCEAPYHRMEWQFQSTEGCDKHQLRLLSRCPACDEKIPLPVEWDEGRCKKCGMKFTSMRKKQKPY